MILHLFQVDFYMGHHSLCVNNLQKFIFWGPNPRKDLATSTALRFSLFVCRLILFHKVSPLDGLFSFQWISLVLKIGELWKRWRLSLKPLHWLLAGFPTWSWHTPKASMSHFSALPELVKECHLEEISFTFSKRFSELHVFFLPLALRSWWYVGGTARGLWIWGLLKSKW